MRRENRIEVLLTDSERTVVVGAATRSGSTVSGYVRMAIMLAEANDGLARQNLVDRAAVAALNMIGSNINQIARVANESKTMAPEQVRALGAAYKRLHLLVLKIEGTSQVSTK